MVEGIINAPNIFCNPVTKKWIRRFVLALILICHSSFKGVIEILDSLFGDRNISLGTIHNIVMAATHKAATINKGEDLSSIRYGAPDEIFQKSKPVLVGVDLESTYCYLPSAEELRDETMWGVHLLELMEGGLFPSYRFCFFMWLFFILAKIDYWETVWRSTDRGVSMKRKGEELRGEGRPGKD